jgi:hypothetical protein
MLKNSKTCISKPDLVYKSKRYAPVDSFCCWTYQRRHKKIDVSSNTIPEVAGSEPGAAEAIQMPSGGENSTDN